ncbi:MAG: 50S ribosomal protein L29 [Nitrospirae bacterium]|nr:50S ribosomal protein L29 [Nitrospirota bacterium]
MSLKSRELREMTGDELGKKLQDISNDMLKARLEARGRRGPASAKGRLLRRDKARILTIMRQKEKAAHAEK